MHRRFPPSKVAGRSREVMIFLVALAYGTILSQIPDESFKDWDNYLNYGAHSLRILSVRWDQGILTFLSNEPLWLILNIGLASFLTPEQVVRSIILTSATVSIWLAFRQSPRNLLWISVFLLVPSVLMNYFMHIRQGAALALFLLGWVSTYKPFRWTLMLAAPFFHSVFAFIVGTIVLIKLMEAARFGPSIRQTVVAAFSVAIGLSSLWIAAMLGARHAQRYEFGMADVSGMGFVFWSCILFLMCLQSRVFFRKHIHEIGLLTLYLISYWLVQISGRILEASILLILLACLSLTGWRALAFRFAIVFLLVAQWIMRAKEPAFGF